MTEEEFKAALLKAVAEEREQCALVADAPDAWWSAEFGEDGGVAKAIADCIRQRGRWVEEESRGGAR